MDERTQKLSAITMCREVESKGGEKINKRGQTVFFGPPRDAVQRDLKGEVGGVLEGRDMRGSLGKRRERVKGKRGSPAAEGSASSER